jgi:membrane protease YdiL (CAAX protease family)
VKRCDYCGKEYPDDAVVCTLDRNPLLDPAAPTEVKVEVIASSLAQPTPVDLFYPEYRWSARDAWKFLGMIVVFDFLWYAVTGALATNVHWYRVWRWSPYGSVTMTSVFITINVLTAAYFARTETVATFCEAMGLNRRPTSYVWFGVAAALGIRLFGHVIYLLGWVRGYSNFGVDAFRSTRGPERYLYLFSLIAAAFWEEPVKRGFVYTALRGSYSVPASVAIIIGYTAYAHWSQYAHLGWAVFSLSALTVVQCYLREKSGSIWDCILCHLTFNGSMLFVNGILRY